MLEGMWPTRQIDVFANDTIASKPGRYQWKTSIISKSDLGISQIGITNTVAWSRHVTDGLKLDGKTSEKTKGHKQSIGCHQKGSPGVEDFVKTYVDRRTLNSLDFPKSVRANEERNLHAEKTGWPNYLLPLRFEEDVVYSRSEQKREPHTSFHKADMTNLYKPKEMVSKKGCTKSSEKERPAHKPKSVFITKHQPCLPEDSCKESQDFCKIRKRLRANRVVEEKERKVNSTKSTHLWEKHVLGLMSRQTAQWIANQCSSGDQRERLIHFLDNKYLEDYQQNGGTAKVNKILEVNDDAICWPIKRNTSLENM